jgi:hypothetical protein
MNKWIAMDWFQFYTTTLKASNTLAFDGNLLILANSKIINIIT